MTAFEAYKMYVALKLHFTSEKYDYFRFNGKTKASEQNFEKRRDRYFFKKLVNKYSKDEIPCYFVANLISGEHAWVGSMLKSNGDETYTEWKRRMESLHYSFGEDVDFLLSQVENFDHLFRMVDTHPLILKFYLGKKISIETFVILNKILNFVGDFDKKIQEPLVWKDVRNTVVKYSPFLDIDINRYKKTLKDKVLEHKCLFSTPT